MSVDVMVKDGSRIAAPVALVRNRAQVFVHEFRNGDHNGRAYFEENKYTDEELAPLMKNAVREINVWNLTSDLDEILAAEDFRMVSTMEEADRIVVDQGGSKFVYWEADTSQRYDPPLKDVQATGLRRKFTIWTEPLLETVRHETFQQEVEKRGVLYTNATSLKLKDVRTRHVCVWAKCGNRTVSAWSYEYKHVPGLEKRREAARARGQQRRLANPPTLRDLRPLLNAMGRISMSSVGDDTHSVTLESTFGYRGDVHLSQMRAEQIHTSLESIIEIQRRLGNPWMSFAEGRLQRSLILKRRDTIGEDNVFMTKLLQYLDSLET